MRAQPFRSLSPQSALVADYLTLSLLGMIFVPVAAFTFLLMLDAGSIRWCIPSGLALGWPVACLLLLRGASLRLRLTAIALLAAMIIATFLLTGFGYDTSYDGLAYHADAILSLLRGDNPYYGGLTGNDQGFDFWTLHYPKASWYFAALVIHLTGHFQAGKIYNLLLIYAVFGYALVFCLQRSMAMATSLLMAAATALGPVQASQLWTLYVDGALGSLLTLLLFSSLNLLNRPNRIDWPVFLMAGCLLINLKFTGIVYALVICAVSGVLLLWRWRIRKQPEALRHIISWTAGTILLFVTGVAVMGFDPYITNTIEEGNPVYPLAGPHKTDAITHLMPPAYRPESVSSFSRLMQSVFCRGVFISPSDLAAHWKWPFSFTMKDIEQFKEPDVKISGWGVLFSGLLLAAMALYGFARGWQHEEATFAALATLATVLVNPHAWWARFAPQLALVPLFLTAACLQSASRKIRATAVVLPALFLMNSLLILIPNTLYYHVQAENIDAQADHILGACGQGHYAVFGSSPFHYEQFLEWRGIVREGHMLAKPAPAGALPFRELLLMKKNCD